jgi:hypothetical protein
MIFRCRLRKIRCDGSDPCSSCSKAGADCQRHETSRMLYVPQAYVEELEQRVRQFKSQDSQPTAVDPAFLNSVYEDNDPSLNSPLMHESDDTSFDDGLRLWEEAFNDTYHLKTDQLATWDIQLALDAEAVQNQGPRSPADLRFDAVLASSATQAPEKRGKQNSHEASHRSTLGLWPRELKRSLLVFTILTCVFLPLSFTTWDYAMNIQDWNWSQVLLSYTACAIQFGWVIAGMRVLLPLLQNERRSFKIISRRPASLGVISFQLWLHRVMPISLLRILRPTVKHGCQRLEWKCTCGRRMYGDYATRDNMQNATLPQSLPGCRISGATPNPARSFSSISASNHDERNSHFQKTFFQRLLTCKQSLTTLLDPRFSSDAILRGVKEDEAADNDALDTPAAPTTNHQDAQSTPTGSNFSISGVSNPSNRITGESSTQVSDTSSSRSASAARLYEGTPAFFELCVNGSKTRVSLGEITIRDGLGKCRINTDMALFSES